MVDPAAPDGSDWSSAARAAVAHVFVDDITDPKLAPEDGHHLARVLRVRAGETVSVADGRGGWRTAAFVAGGSLEARCAVQRIEAPRPPVTIAMALVKGDRSEWAVQKLTELGVDRIVPLTTMRGVVRWEQGRAGRHLVRWRAVARQAAMQSRLLRVPLIEEPTSPADLAAGDLDVVMAEPGGAPPGGVGAAVLIGPEGGWAPEELGLGLPMVGLGVTVLRTETAAIVAGALLVGLRSGTVLPSVDT